MKNQIQMTDTAMDMILKLCGGNPGAVRVCAELMKLNPVVDPDDAFGEFGKLLSLDSYGLNGSRIWMLYKDLCGCDISRVIAMLRAVQLGIISEGHLNVLIDRPKHDFMEATCKQVKEKLPKFQLTELQPA